METADFAPIQHYYRMLPGERKQTEEMGRAGEGKWNARLALN